MSSNRTEHEGCVQDEVVGPFTYAEMSELLIVYKTVMEEDAALLAGVMMKLVYEEDQEKLQHMREVVREGRGDLARRQGFYNSIGERMILIWDKLTDEQKEMEKEIHFDQTAVEMGFEVEEADDGVRVN